MSHNERTPIDIVPALPVPPGVQVPAESMPLAASESPDPGDGPIAASPSKCKHPEVCILAKQVPEAVVEAMKALQKHNSPPTLFRYRGQVVKLVAAAGEPVGIIPLGIPDLQVELSYAARWFETTEKGTKPVYPPSPVVRDVLQHAQDWAPLLREVVQVPVFAKDWRLLIEPGYHHEDQLFYFPNHPAISPVSEHPTADEADQARRLICEELLGDFPFVTASDRAAAVAALIVPFVRPQIEGPTPLHLVDSPQPGSGKTLLADVIAIPALGKEPAANTEIANGDDLRKWVTSMAVAGESIILIDNINSRLKGSALAAALTTVEWSDRIVGTNRLAKGTMRPLWLATGNNVAMTSEMARRIVRSRIDAGVQLPHLRKGFRHPDLRGWAKANRPRQIRAILILVRNWLAKGRPDGRIILGSYESYSRIVGGILAAAGIAGFLANIRADQRHADDETAEWEAFIHAWGEHFGDKRVVAEELDKAILAPNPEMLSITLASTSSERGRRIKLGQELRRRRDAILAGWRIKVSGAGCGWPAPHSKVPA